MLRRELLVAIASIAVTTALWGLGWLPVLERPVGDLLLRTPRPGHLPPAPLAAVLIDDASVAARGATPWPRVLMAELVERIRDLGAEAVAIDIILSDPTTAADDQALARAIESGPTVLAAALRPGGGWLLPLERFGRTAHAAHIHAEVAEDGVVRLVSSTKQASGIALEAFSLAAARLAGWNGALTPGVALRPDFRRSPDDIETLSAAEVLDGAVMPEALSGRVVFVGLSASGAGDQFVPPVGGGGRPVPGVLLHAAIAAAVLAGGLLGVPPPWLTLAAALVFALMVQLIRSRAGRLPWTPLVLMPVVVLCGSVAALWVGRRLVPVVTIVIAIFLSAIIREIVESREAQRQTDTILHSLIRKHGSAALPPVPSGVGGRLQLVRDLEERLDLRRREMQRLVSHELKTPLASISGFSSMLETYALSDDELHRVAGMIRGEADRLGDMVRTFLDLERLGSGVEELQREPIDLGDLVRSRCALLERVAEDRGQRLEVDIVAGARVFGAPQLLERLIDNLVGNAIKYSPVGRAIEIGVRREPGWSVVEISDHGPGIPGEALPHLFERFYRQPGQAAPGSGLGLAVVKEFADWHGATVEVDSTVGRGSTFTVRLPYARREGEGDAAEGTDR